MTFRRIRLGSPRDRDRSLERSAVSHRQRQMSGGHVTEVHVAFRAPTRAIFDAPAIAHGNDLCFRLSPEVAISLTARAKVPGDDMVGEDVRLIERRHNGDEMVLYPIRASVNDVREWDGSNPDIGNSFDRSDARGVGQSEGA